MLDSVLIYVVHEKYINDSKYHKYSISIYAQQKNFPHIKTNKYKSLNMMIYWFSQNMFMVLLAIHRKYNAPNSCTVLNVYVAQTPPRGGRTIFNKDFTSNYPCVVIWRKGVRRQSGYSFGITYYLPWSYSVSLHGHGNKNCLNDHCCKFSMKLQRGNPHRFGK